MNLPMEVDALLEQHYPDLSNETLALVLAARASGLDKASLLTALSSEGQAVYIKKNTHATISPETAKSISSRLLEGLHQESEDSR